MSVVDLLAGGGRGPLWGAETEDLNLTLLAWPPGEGPPEHTNTERDVVVVVLAGSGTAVLDGEEHPVRSGHAVVIPQGTARAIVAGPDGIRYLSLHRRRGGLQIEPVRPVT
jgi:quercetin dioxygenase-like cupin family protein